jgi:hypothetical protein
MGKRGPPKGSKPTADAKKRRAAGLRRYHANCKKCVSPSKPKARTVRKASISRAQFMRAKKSGRFPSGVISKLVGK